MMTLKNWPDKKLPNLTSIKKEVKPMIIQLKTITNQIRQEILKNYKNT